MKKTILIALMALIGLSAFAQSAQQVLDRTAKVIGNKSGASANFTISNAKIGSSSGTIAIKGNKFNRKQAKKIEAAFTSYKLIIYASDSYVLCTITWLKTHPEERERIREKMK